MKTMTIDETFQNIMVIVPHQDDEILLTAGILAKAVESNVSVKVVMATNGDYGSSDERIGRARLRETIEGLRVLGVKEEDILFLGYADMGMPEEESFLYNLYQEKDADKKYISHCSDHTYGLEEKPDYHYRKYGKQGAYTRRTFLEDLEEVIREYKPGHIFTTAFNDIHGDHSGLFLFVTEALRNLNREEKEYQPVLFSGIVHSLVGDENWPQRSRRNKELIIENFTEPENFDSLCTVMWEDRISFPVTEEMTGCSPEENKKAIALSKHVTALKDDAVEFLYSFLKTEELFWQIEWR